MDKKIANEIACAGYGKGDICCAFRDRRQLTDLISLFTCKLRSIRGNVIHIEEIEALDGSPVIDIKPYIPRIDSIPDATVPGWIKKE